MEVLVDSRRTLIVSQDASSHNSCSMGKKSFDEHLRFCLRWLGKNQHGPQMADENGDLPW